MNQKRFLGIDYGKARIGLAISDTYNNLALGYKVLRVKSSDSVYEQLNAIFHAENIGTLVIGFPTDIDGNPTPMCEQVTIFSQQLQKYFENIHFPIEIIFWNETLTSFEAEENLHLKKIPFLPKDGLIDIESARIILQEYLNSR